MTLRSRPAKTPKQRPPAEPPRLSLRWLIIALAAAGAYLLGVATADPAAGVALACTVAGLLHMIIE